MTAGAFAARARGQARQREADPHIGLHEIPRHGAAICIEESKIGLCEAVSLLGRLAIPFRRRDIIPIHATPLGIERTKAVLGEAIALFRCLAPPARRLGIILSYAPAAGIQRSEEHTSELQSLMRISYAVFCLKKQK